MKKSIQKPLNRPIDNGIKTMLQHQVYMVSKNQFLSSIKIIELAARCDYPQLARVVTDAFHSYNDIQTLIKYFMLFGINPYPDSNWNRYEEMNEELNRTKKDFLSRLNEEATFKLKAQGIIQ